MSKNNRESSDKDFLDSYNEWYSFCIVPVSYQDMLYAVACGDAEVSLVKDDDWPEDYFFKWNRKSEDRIGDWKIEQIEHLDEKETSMDFYEDEYVAVTEDGVANLTKVISISGDSLKLVGFDDLVHQSKVCSIEFAEEAFPRCEMDGLVEDAKLCNKIISQILKINDYNKKTTIECPICDGSGHEGFDREDPPNPYVCSCCDGAKELSLEPNKNKSETKTEIKTNAIDFEKEYGSVNLLKIMMSALNQLLASKNVIKPEQLQEYLAVEMELFKGND